MALQIVLFATHMEGEKKMPDIDEKKLELAREIANGMDEASNQRVFAVIALFSGVKKDLDKANSVIPANKVVYIKVLLALGNEKEAATVIQGLSREDEGKNRSEAEKAFAFFYVSQGRIEDAKNRVYDISDPSHKVVVLQEIARCREKMMKKMDDELAELRSKLALATVKSVAEKES